MPMMGIWWKKSTYTLGKVWVPILQLSQFDAFHCIFLCYEKLMGNSFVSQVIKYTIGWESDRKKPQILLEMGTHGSPRFPQGSPGSPHICFFCIFLCYGKLMGNSLISHMMKYTIRWELDGKKAPVLWENYEYQYPRFSPFYGFCFIFLYYGKFMGKPMHFLYYEIC